MAPFVEMEWGTKAYDLMWELKQLFDPTFVLNPGVVLNRVGTCPVLAYLFTCVLVVSQVDGHADLAGLSRYCYPNVCKLSSMLQSFGIVYR